MELQTILVRDRIADLHELARELRTADGPDSRLNRIRPTGLAAGTGIPRIRLALGRRVIGLGEALAGNGARLGEPLA